MDRGRAIVNLLACVLLVASCAAEVSPTPTPAASPATPTPTPTAAPSVAPSAGQSTAASPSATAIPTASVAPPPNTCGKVVSTTSAGTATGSRPLAKYEPPDGSTYVGFAFRLWEGDSSWGDTRPFADRICDAVDVELSGKVPAMLWVWGDWNPGGGPLVPFSAAKADIDKIHAALGPTVVPFLQWTLGAQETTSTASITTKDVASGAYDGYVRQYASDVKAYGEPLFIAPICFEMNGDWWPTCSPKANPKLTRSDFVSAWKRVVDIFREQEVTNVAWVWAPVTPFPAGQGGGWDAKWQAYYPGDAYVDWIGSSLFEWGQPNWLEPVYKFAVAHAKPYVLAQFGIRGSYTKMTHSQHVRWLTAALDYIERHGAIKAIFYWNYRMNPDSNPTGPGRISIYDGQVTYVANVNDDDCRLLAGGTDVRSLFAKRIAKARYISAIAGP